jgi:hypothetical protein
VTPARWSLIVGVVGLAVTFGVLGHRRRQGRQTPTTEWVLGLLALMPAWLVAFVGLLQAATSGPLDRGVRRMFMVSCAALLLGVIVSDGLARRRWEAARGAPGPLYWLLGVGAVVPAWVLVLLWLG